MARIIDIKLPKAIAFALRLPQNDPRSQQLRVLKKLLKKARFTAFGQHYGFDKILLNPDRDKAFAAITRRVPFYSGLTLLRIARNTWIGDKYSRQLLDEARKTLR